MKFIYVLIFSLSLPIIAIPYSAHAATETVSATIDSKISKAHSTVTVSAYEVLADPASHSILITVTLHDAADAPLPGLNVVLSSTRGSVDIIEAISKLGTGLGYDDMRRDVTNAQGVAAFKISSYIPGKTTINILADQIVSFDPVDLQFDPLPFPANVTITVTIPGSNKEIILFEPKYKTSDKLVNLGTKIQIPLIYFLLFIVVIILCPILLILNYMNLRKIRRMEKEALQHLENIEKKEEQDT
jgi:hypothetical protein